MLSAFKNRSHESFDRKEKLVVGSDRKFGFTFAVVFFLLSISTLLIPVYVRVVLILACVITTAVAMMEPHRLHSANVQWMRFGMLLGKVISPVILAFLFYAVFLPVGLLLKLVRKDILNLKLKPEADSYWIDSTLAPPTSMKDQF
ncbi:MAG: hypothetical protein K0R29_1860 [Pseudobdellovibrio sp.]|jgi:hypothetical protein|nr:hypothetical protein [Pseudobdellovibrio sp.]